MKNYFLDTNVLFALFSENDALHTKANQEFRKIADANLKTSVIVVAELIASNEDFDFLEAILALNIEIIDVKFPHLIYVDQEIEPRKRKKLKANDTLILAQAFLSESELITFDKKLKKAFTANS
jgi:predicted nucleic acid-binding protein